MELRGDWENIFSLCGEPSVFLTWEWVFTWADYFMNGRRNLFIMVVREDEKVVGIAPWYIERGKAGSFGVRVLRFLGTPEGGSDYLDVLSLPGQEEKVALSIHEFLFKKGRRIWDFTEFQDVNPDSLFFHNFITRQDEEGRFFEIKRGAYCPRIDLPEKSEDYFDSLSRNRRQQFKRHLRILQDGGGVEHETHKKIDDISFFHDFMLLYQKRWGGGNPAFPGFIEAVFHRLSEKGRAQLDFIRKDGSFVAGILHLQAGKRRDYYMMAADRSFSNRMSIGNVIIGLSIMNAINDGCNTYDFLKGDEAYKFSWAKGGTQLLTYFFFKKTPGALLRITLDSLKNVGKAWLR